MTPKFPGFPAAGIDFLKGLEENNNREWFQERKPIFDSAVKAPMMELIEAFNAHLAELAPKYVTPAAKSLYRIYRDTRFSKDKTPYKNHIAALFPHQNLPKNACAGFFFSIAANSIEFAAGLYSPEPDQLIAVRHYIAENHKELRKLINNSTLQKLMGPMKGDQLTRPPKGFPSDHPAADLVRHKQWVFYTSGTIDPRLATSPKLLSEFVVRTKALAPFVDFFNRPLVPMHRKKESTRVMLEI